LSFLFCPQVANKGAWSLFSLLFARHFGWVARRRLHLYVVPRLGEAAEHSPLPFFFFFSAPLPPFELESGDTCFSLTPTEFLEEKEGAFLCPGSPSFVPSTERGPAFTFRWAGSVEEVIPVLLRLLFRPSPLPCFVMEQSTRLRVIRKSIYVVKFCSFLFPFPFYPPFFFFVQTFFEN